MWKEGDNGEGRGRDHVISFYSKEPETLRMKITRLIFYKTTHGIIQNPNSAQPFVPLLGDREESLRLGDSAWSRGLNQGRRRMLWLWGPLSKTPDGSLMIANDVILVTANGSNTNNAECIYSPDHSYTTDQIQKAFQYPNVFKVVKPTDPDYEQYNSLLTKKDLE